MDYIYLASLEDHSYSVVVCVSDIKVSGAVEGYAIGTKQYRVCRRFSVACETLNSTLARECSDRTILINFSNTMIECVRDI